MTKDLRRTLTFISALSIALGASAWLARQKGFSSSAAAALQPEAAQAPGAIRISSNDSPPAASSSDSSPQADSPAAGTNTNGDKKAQTVPSNTSGSTDQSGVRNIDLNFPEKRIVRDNYNAELHVGTPDAAKGLQVQAGTQIHADRIDMKLVNVHGKATFRGNFEKLSRLFRRLRSSDSGTTSTVNPIPDKTEETK